MKKAGLSLLFVLIGWSGVQAQMTDKEIDLWNYALKNMGKEPIDNMKFREDPLGDITEDMKISSEELAALKTDAPVQELQENILAKMDKLIEGMQKKCSSCSSGSGTASAQPTRPAAKSVIMKGPGGTGDLHAPKDGHKKWADLPDKERDKIMQSLSEGFPPGYQVILERYYKNLAEEKVGGHGDASLVPTAE